jgi:hypothetical protein
MNSLVIILAISLESTEYCLQRWWTCGVWATEGSTVLQAGEEIYPKCRGGSTALANAVHIFYGVLDLLAMLYVYNTYSDMLVVSNMRQTYV